MSSPFNEVAYRYFAAALAALGGGTSSQRVQGSVASGAAAGNPIVIAGAVSGNAVQARLVGNNADAQTATSAANSAGLAVVSYGSVFNGTTWDRVKKPNAAARLPSSASSDNATLVKNAAGDVFAINGYNSTAGVIYLKLYNLAVAPTVGTSTPAYTLALPPSAPFSFNLQNQYFGTGIGYGLTTGAADADTGAVTAGAILGLNIAYQ